MTLTLMTNDVAALWALLHVHGAAKDVPRALRTDDEEIFGASFDVTGFARDAVAVASLAAAELLAARTATELPTVEVSTLEAASAFRSEALFEPSGWARPALWDPIAGDYLARDRWIRLHTNYATHRRAALSVLGCSPDRESVEAAVATYDAATLEASIVAEGGSAAAMYTRDEWRVHEHGRYAVHEPPVALLEHDASCAGLPPLASTSRAPFEGLRVLDLTRVIAGPVCTRFLAAHGANVLRIDPPGFEEVPAVLPESTAGKRCAFLDLHGKGGRDRLFELVAEADVMVHALRPSALENLGFGDDALLAANPSLVVATLDAYGWEGPWKGRRGFDSLVQMSAGIAADAGTDRPRPLPAQALDHGTGYLVAAAVARALTRRAAHGRISRVRASLVGAANHLVARPRPAPLARAFAWPKEQLEPATTAWGEARRVPCPGRIGGVRGHWARAAGPLGTSAPSFV